MNKQNIISELIYLGNNYQNHNSVSDTEEGIKEELTELFKSDKERIYESR